MLSSNLRLQDSCLKLQYSLDYLKRPEKMTASPTFSPIAKAKFW
jgi:hypothetical protein